LTSSGKQRPPIWPPLIATSLLLFVWLGYWYQDTFSSIVNLWETSDTYAHGYVVLPIALWLIWSERKELSSHSPQPGYLLTFLALPLVFVWLLGEVAAVNAVTQPALGLLVIISIVAMIGVPLAKKLAFPLVFLLFAIPFGEFMMPKLMDWTADFTVLALRLSGIPVYREGLQFVIPSGNWSVVEACSGIRYIIASLMVGTLFAYLNFTSTKRRLIFMLAALLVPIIANWLRAYLIVMLGHISGNKLAAGVDHLIYGWVFFGIVIGALFAVSMRWAQVRPSTTEADITYSPVPRAQQISALTKTTILLALFVAIGPVTYRQITGDADTAPTRTLQFPSSEFPDLATREFEFKPAWQNPSAEGLVQVKAEEAVIGIYIARYGNQSPQRKLISSTNMLATYQDPHWRITAQSLGSITMGNESLSVQVADLIQQADANPLRLKVVYWYFIGDDATASPVKGKLLTARNQLLGQGDQGAVVVLYTPADANALERLSRFAKVNAENIKKMATASGSQ